jgi:hypothetical protein
VDNECKTITNLYLKPDILWTTSVEGNCEMLSTSCTIQHCVWCWQNWKCVQKLQIIIYFQLTQKGSGTCCYKCRIWRRFWAYKNVQTILDCRNLNGARPRADHHVDVIANLISRSPPTFWWNISSLLLDCMALRPRRQHFPKSLLWEPQIYQVYITSIGWQKVGNTLYTKSRVLKLCLWNLSDLHK